MFGFKLGFAILFCAMALFVCRVVVRTISKALQTGQWRTRTGVADRLTSPKTFWFFLFYVSCFAILGMAAGIFLIFAALTSK